jgi:hypothetical protein
VTQSIDWGIIDEDDSNAAVLAAWYARCQSKALPLFSISEVPAAFPFQTDEPGIEEIISITTQIPPY